MGLAESVAGKGFHLPPDLQRRLHIHPQLHRIPDKAVAVLHERLLDALAAHGAAQLIRRRQTPARNGLRHLDHILLIEHDAVGFLQQFRQGGMYGLHRFFAMVAFHEMPQHPRIGGAGTDD